MNSSRATCFLSISWTSWIVLLAILIVPASPVYAQCGDTAAGYQAYATAHGWYIVSGTSASYASGRGPSEDPDGDGLTNEQEFEGWSTMLNGTNVWFTYNSTHSPNVNCGPSFDMVDTDCDGVSDYVEYRSRTNPRNADTDGDGMGDAWEIYVGLDPCDNGTVNADNAPDADPDGDGLSNLEEMNGPNCSYPGVACATASTPFTQPAFGADDFTIPLLYDSDGDRLIDSYEYGYGLNPVVADDADADLDADGLTAFREQCVHPLLAFAWFWNEFRSTYLFTPSVMYGVSGYTYSYTRKGLMTPGYLNLAEYNAVGDSAAAPGGVRWGHPVAFSQNSCFSGTRRWTECNDADSDGDLLPDGWEIEHGLNPLAGGGLVENGVLHVSGALGDPDDDSLYNYQEYFGQDGYRIDYITGTGDETDPWIMRVFNNTHRGDFALRIGQSGMGARGDQSPVGYANNLKAIYAPTSYPGFFDPEEYATATNYVPIPGVPPFVELNDTISMGAFNGSFNPFATAKSGILFQDNDADGRYTPGVDDAWLALASPGVYTLGDPILADVSGLTGGEAGLSIVRNTPYKWPIPGNDTDDDGLPDALEIQMDVAAGKQPTSPVQSHNPFFARSAKITSNSGIQPNLFDTIMDEDGLLDGRRFFSRDFTIETWVYLSDLGSNDYRGAFIQGVVWFDAAGSFTRVGYELGVETNAGKFSVPYVSFNTLADKRYKVSAAASMPKNRWVHLAGVFDPTRSSLSLYIDGLLEQSLQVSEESSAMYGVSKGGRLTLALDKGGGQHFATNLWLDEVRVWGVPRTADEIANNRGHLIEPVQLVSGSIYSNVEPNALFAYYTFDDGGTSAEDLCRRAKCSLEGYAYPHDTNVLSFLDQEYLYGDRAFALDSDALKGADTSFVFDANRTAPVIGTLDAERGEFDSDNDGLPDSWEIVHELNPFKSCTPDHDQIKDYDAAWGTAEGPANDAVRDVELPSGDGLDNINEYWAHTNPRKNDTDANGVEDGAEDFDVDGLPNLVEIANQTRPDLADTDDDGFPDSVEQANSTLGYDSRSPDRDMAVRFDGYPGSYLEVPERAALRLSSWTIEASILPAADHNLASNQGAAVVRRSVMETTNGLLAANYELRIVNIGTGLVPEARYIYFNQNGMGFTNALRASPTNGASFIPTTVVGTNLNAFTHLSATYNELSGAFSLFMNGKILATTNTVLTRPPTSGRGPRVFTRIGEGFRGDVDDVRIWAGALLDSVILQQYGNGILGTETNLITWLTLDDGGWAVTTNLAYVATNVIRSVRFSAAPASPVEGDTWYTGGSVYIRESGKTFSMTAPAKVFREGTMAVGSATSGEFAWWVSRNEYYRYDPAIFGWKRWGRGLEWLADARAMVKTNVANEVALTGMSSAPVIGDTYFIESPASFYTYRGPDWTVASGWVSESALDGDRIVVSDSSNVYDYDGTSSSLRLIANASTDGGGLVIYVRNMGAAYRSDGASWKRWGFVPCAEDMTTSKNWLDLWDRASTFFGNCQSIVYAAESGGGTLDTDGDGLPDWWEIKYNLDPNDPTGSNGADGDPDADGLTNLSEYEVGTNPLVQDTGATGVPDAQKDSDGDGLANIAEQNTYKTNPADPDTDDDNVSDGDELNPLIKKADGRYVTSPVESRSPLIQRSLVMNGTAITVPNAVDSSGVDRFNQSSWTLEAWVNLASSNETGSVIIRRLADGRTNYALRVVNNKPQVEFYSAANGHVVAGANLTIPSNTWTYLSGVWDATNDTLKLYVNGVGFASQVTLDDPVSGSGTMVIGDGARGFVDELRVWKVVRNKDEIQEWAYKHLFDLNQVGALPPLDMVFIIDTSGSMYSYITDVKSNLTTFVNTLDARGFDVQLAGVRYSDTLEGGGTNDRPPTASGFYSNASSYVSAWLDPLSMDYGGDLPEDGLAALTLALDETSFSPTYRVGAQKVFVLLTDASVKNTEDSTDVGAIQSLSTVISNLISANVIVDAIDAGASDIGEIVDQTGGDRFDIEASDYSVLMNSLAASIVKGVLLKNLMAYYTFDDGQNTTITNSIDHLVHTQGAEDSAHPLDWDYALKGVTFSATNESPMMILGERDLDGNGIPDWWEYIYFGGNVDATADFDMDSLNNLYEYYSDTNPKDSDTDNDGVLDTQEDADSDGLMNLDEQTSGTDPRLWDTDDDGLSDGQELKNGSDPADSLSPRRGRYVQFAGNASDYMELPSELRFALPSFTLEARIDPNVTWSHEGVILRRSTGFSGSDNFVMGLTVDRMPYVRFMSFTGLVEVVGSNAVPAGTMNNTSIWTWVQASYDATTHELFLYVNGIAAGWARDVNPPAYNGVWPIQRIGENFDGRMDEVRIWSAASGVFEKSVKGDEGNLVALYTFDDSTGCTPGPDGRWGTADDTGFHRGQVEEFVRKTAEPYEYEKDWRYLYLHGASLYGLITNVVEIQAYDSDGDGLPDDWELANGLDPFDDVGDNGATGDPDGDGLNNYYEYLTSNDPRLRDSDGDSVVDGQEDFDNDGLPNIEEQNVTKTRPDLVDTDDDSLTDYQESVPLQGQRTSDPLLSLDPPKQLSLSLNGNSRMTVQPQTRHKLAAWTLETWVWPSNNANGIIIRRAVSNWTHRVWGVNYELGVTNSHNTIVPYVQYVGVTSSGTLSQIRVDGTGPSEILGGNQASLSIPAEEWTHLAASYDPDGNTLKLYVNGDLAAYRADAFEPTGLGLTEENEYYSELTVGGGFLSGLTVENGFEGYLDEVMLLGGVASDDRIREDASKGTALWAGTMSASATTPTSTKELPLSEALNHPYKANEVLVRFQSGVTPAAAASMISTSGVATVRAYEIAPIYRLQISDGMTVSQKLVQLRANANILYAEPNYKAEVNTTPNDPLFDMLWAMNNNGQDGGTADADIDATEAWSVETGSRDIVVAVIDTGVDYTHSDLAANRWVNEGEIPTNGIDDDGNGYIDDVYGYDFANSDGDPMDDNGHGTHVSGTIGAVGNNAVGVAGVNWQVRIMAVKFLDSTGSGWYSDAISAVEYAWRNGARISNNSWGGYGYSQGLYDAFLAAKSVNHLAVCSAGNYGWDNDEWPCYPASFDLDNIVSVAASDRNDALTEWSNYGEVSVDLAAPGESIYSTIPGGGYGSKSGTSMAAPHVAGAAALLLAQNPSMSYNVVKQMILNGADKKASMEDKMVVAGRLNVARMVGSGGSPLAYFSFDDHGQTAEDFTMSSDWNTSWSHAGTLFNASFTSNEFFSSMLDTDHDGLPDWWELATGLDRYSDSGDNGAEGDPDGDGLDNNSEFRAGTNPNDADTDHDGVTDYNEDADNDGLSNGQEQENTQTDPGLADTDDDGVNDNIEINKSTDPLSAYSPETPRAYEFDGTGRLKINTELDTDIMTNWTVEAWARPASVNSSGIIIRRAEKYAFPVTNGFRWIDYEIGMSNNIPYAKYAYRQGASQVVVQVSGSLPVGTNWVHLAVVHDVSSSQLRLFINGKRVAYQHPAELPPTGNRGSFESTIGGGEMVSGGVVNGFQGGVDAVRVWDYARSGSDIQDSRGVLLPEYLADDPDNRRSAKRLFNFDDGGTSAQNSYYTNDWVTGWQHAAVQDSAGGVVLVDAPFPPLALDSDDDGIGDADEHTGNWMDDRSESPYIPKAMSFDGTGGVFVDELIDNTATMLYALTNWTVEAWVQPTATPTATSVPLVTRRSWDGGWKTFEIGLINTAGTLRAYSEFNRDDSGHKAMAVLAGATVPVGTNATDWTHLAATFSSNTLILYVNGVEAIRSRQVGASPMASMQGYLMFGWTNFVGELREVRIWNRARTLEEVVNNMHASLLFSAALEENSYDAASQNAAYLGRDTETNEDGLVYDRTSRIVLEDGYAYTYGRIVHKWTLESWIRMQPGAAGGILAERKVDLMLNPEGADWRPCHRLSITEDGKPKMEWAGQVNIYTPIYESNVVVRYDVTTEAVTRNLETEVDIRDGEWHHVASVGDSQTVKLYIDGRLEAESVSYYVFMARPAPSFEMLYYTYNPIGSVLRVADNGLDAQVDEVMFWNEDRTQEEIQHDAESGLTRKDIRNGRIAIDPLPENAVDDGDAHVDLVSYITFDGQISSPFVSDEANDSMDYRMLSLPGGSEILANTRPPIHVDRLRTYRGVLSGYFAADDGGDSVENYMQRNDWGYAGQLLAGSSFRDLTADHLNDDADGDGLPDWWEMEHNLDPGSAEGLDGAWGDADKDGLNNRSEFLAGTDPWNFDTYGTGFSDYDSRTNAGERTFGELYSDGDGMEDSWETQYPGVLSPLLYDANNDPDNDGWSNLSEFMFAASDTNGIVVHSTNPTDLNSHPVPKISFTFMADGSAANGPVKVLAYHVATMDGTPDASINISVSNAVFPYLATIQQWDSGWVREGQNWFFAFQDKNNDDTWNEGELAGLAQLQPINIGWGDVSNVVINLTSTPQGYARFSWPAVEGAVAYTVTVRNVSGGNGTWVIPQRVIQAPRTYFHEGDFQLVGTNGLPNGTHQWFVAASNGTYITNGYIEIRYPTNLSTPVASTPLGNVVFAKNDFTWTMDTNATQFRLQISTNAMFSTVLYSALVNTTYRDVNGKYHYTLPIYAGDGWFTNRTYCWRIQALNPRASSAWSAAQSFTVNLQASAAGAYTIGGNAYYFGKVTNGTYIAQAFQSSGFSGVPDSQVTLTNKGSYELMGLREGTYYVRVFIDQNANQQLDAWESWGVVKDSVYETDYSIKALAVPGNQNDQILVVRDRDTDNDNIPDSWEYMYFMDLTTATATSDWDGDGLTDLREYEIEPADTNPRLVDTDGDGISDYDEVWWDGSGDYNPYDPITNPSGTDLNPHKWSTDGSGVADGKQDADADSLNNVLEIMMGTDPRIYTTLFNCSSVAIGDTADVVRFNIDNSVTNVTTNFTARPMWTTNLLSVWYPVSDCTQVVNPLNWQSGPWVKTNAHSVTKMFFYRIDWSSP